MVASIGTGVPITENRKNCQLNINLQYPPGFQYSIFSTEFRGYAGLSANVTGTQSATYYFSGCESRRIRYQETSRTSGQTANQSSQSQHLLKYWHRLLSMARVMATMRLLVSYTRPLQLVFMSASYCPEML